MKLNRGVDNDEDHACRPWLRIGVPMDILNFIEKPRGIQNRQDYYLETLMLFALKRSSSRASREIHDYSFL